jgi:ATP-dependent Zn protease
MRSSGSLGHHQSFEREERFGMRWQSEFFGDLVHVLGAMAAELVFYGQNGNGVSGDLNYATDQVSVMVGIAGMGTPQISTTLPKFADESDEQTRARTMERFEKIGLQIMNRTRGSADVHQDPIASILGDPYKRRIAAQTLGLALATAVNFIAANREQVDHLADTLVEKREIYGDDLLHELDESHFVKPDIDWSKDESWPRI